jgi:prepilin-type N-terminal cleavage/methylation domain-containing protein
MKKGFSLIEVLLAVALFTIFATAAGIAGVSVINLNRFAGDEVVAGQYAAEGLEAARSIKNTSFTDFATPSGAMGVIKTPGNIWAWAGTGNSTDSGRYTRQITLSSVNANTKKVTSTVSWNYTTGQTRSVDVSTYLTNWKAAIGKGGMLVYGDGGTTTDAIKYKILDTAGAWSTAQATADVDSGSTNKYLRIAKVFASSTRNEKVLVSRHYNGTGQWIYAQVWNGSAWGNVVQLSTWNATTFLDVQNFDGTYLNNGNFMVVYSDNTVIPKMQIWNGSAWSGQTSLTTLGTSQIPTYVVAKARSGTNEVMAAFFTQASDVISEYYSGSAWSAITSHATTAPLTTKRFVDFDWSVNTSTTGLLNYTNSTTDKTMRGRIWVANGSGSGAWGTVAAAAAQTNNIGAIIGADRPGINEFQVCNKDARATPTIVCRKASFSGNVLTWATPTNPIVGAATDTGIQKSFGVEYEDISGVLGVNVYGDNTTTPKYKKYTASTSTWDVSPTNMTPALGGAVKAVRLLPKPGSDDMIAFVSDANLDVYSFVWNGTSDTMSSSTAHGTNGSAITDYWFDFAWDRY